MKILLLKIISVILSITFIFSPFVWASETAGISVTVTLEHLEIIEAFVEFVPKTIQPKSNYIKCYIELPEPFNVENIDVNTVALTELNGLPIIPSLKPVSRPRIGDYDKDGIPDLKVMFNIQTLIPLLEAGENRLTVTGNIVVGRQFRGTGTISFIVKRNLSNPPHSH